MKKPNRKGKGGGRKNRQKHVRRQNAAKAVRLVASPQYPVETFPAGGDDTDATLLVAPLLEKAKPARHEFLNPLRWLGRRWAKWRLEREVDGVLDETSPTATVLAEAPRQAKQPTTGKNWPLRDDPPVSDVDAAWLELAEAEASSLITGPSTARKFLIGCATMALLVVAVCLLVKAVQSGGHTPEIAQPATSLICAFEDGVAGECAPDQIDFTHMGVGPMVLATPRITANPEHLSGSQSTPNSRTKPGMEGELIATLTSELTHKHDVLERRERRAAHNRNEHNNRLAIQALQGLLQTPTLAAIIKDGSCDGTLHPGQYDWQTRCEVRTFQRWAKGHGYPHIVPDGAVGPLTIEVMGQVIQNK